MSSTSSTDSPRGFQFGFGSLALLTTTLAALAALVRLTRLPLVAQVFVVGYLMAVLGYAILRGPSIWRAIMTQRERRRQLLGRREDLRQWAAETRAREAADVKSS